MRTVYPVGRRPPSVRNLFFVAALSAATMVLLAPSASSEKIVDTVPSQPLDVATESMSAPKKENVAQDHIKATAVLPAASASSSSFVELGAMDSRPAEDLDPFLVRVAQAMDAFTGSTGHEVCGVVLRADDNNSWRVRLTTNRSHIGCAMVFFDEPGFHRFGTDIHSHPRLPGGVQANAQDVQRRPDFECGNRIFVFDETFSGRDLDRGPGYLVSRNRLLYQRGADKPFRQLAVFESLPEPPPLALRAGGTEQPSADFREAAAAAWANEDREGIPSTQCSPNDRKHTPSP